MKRLAISAVRMIIHILLSPLERLLTMRVEPEGAAPPIFIIGAPRSGTSLLYELLVTRYHFAYISNLSHRFYLTPLAAAWLGKKRIENWQGNFESRFGHIEGWGAPNEGGWVWRRWLNDGDWSDGGNYDADKAAALRKLTSGLSAIFGAPFINKNVMHSNRLLLMDRIWPDALFIHVRRDITDNTRSIIRAERKDGGPAHDEDHWWSVRPSVTPDNIGKSDVERAAAQVIGVDADIQRDIQQVGRGHYIKVNYADMCQRPEEQLDKIAEFLARHAVKIVTRTGVPSKFSPPASPPLKDADEKLMQHRIRELTK